MRMPRHFLLLFVFALLFAQQAGAAHALQHALEDLTQQQREGKQAPHSDACKKCADYAQMGNALDIGATGFKPLLTSDEVTLLRPFPFFSARTLPAVARGPPLS